MSQVAAGQANSAVTSRWRWALVLGPIGALGLVWAGWAWWADRNYRSAVMAIELEMANGRFGIAARELKKLLEREPGADEVALLLGRCEQERGRYQAAAAALERVPPGSELSHKAIVGRMRLLHDQGQLAAAEQLICDAALDPRNDGPHTRALLVPIYGQLGRVDEAQRLLKERWKQLDERGEGTSEQAIDQVRMHIELAFKPNSVEDVRAYLDQAGQMAPDDDRVWLGRANLAIRTRDYPEAKRWLEKCVERRPHDVPVWSARLRLGIAANEIDVVKQALEHVPADDLTLAQIHRIDAWLAMRQGDNDSERRALEELIDADPADIVTFDRLAELTEMAGQPARAQDLRGKKAEIVRLRTRYEKLFDRNQPIRDAEEMARIADQLGRTFEARAFLAIEIAADQERDDLRRELRRLAQGTARVSHGGRTLAQVLDQGRTNPKPD
jgi:tetratricopeptide (TPR) repeat protein